MRDFRVYPEGLLRTYTDAFGCLPPEEFMEAYELCADVLYFGTGIDDDAGRIRGGTVDKDWFFGEPRLLRTKGAVDQRLTAIRAELRKWAVSRQGAAPRRSRPAADGRGDLAGARAARDPGAVEQDKEAG